MRPMSHYAPSYIDNKNEATKQFITEALELRNKINSSSLNSEDKAELIKKACITILES